MPFQDNPQEILERCRHCVPVNALVGNAVAAHRIAFARYQQDPGEAEIRKIAFYSLHAIVMAAEQSDDDGRSRLDYLSELPEMAWESRHGFAAENYRDETLAMFARQILLS
jgi:hypothetical protein